MELIAINANGGFIYLLANQNAVNALQNVPNVLVKINAQSAKMDIIGKNILVMNVHQDAKSA